ncbi:MAG TPA: SDR family NAD(P)-dependent oxidoreductase [Acetobacteraceae bacterium]|nr:SDR family NAD(P)-dependent oxidoreductase [Acetobacteraceae bacterium]
MSAPGRAAIVTGGGGEIGGACARHLLAAGWSVLAVDVNPSQLEDLADLAARHSGRLVTQSADATQEAAAEAAAALALERFGRIDGLANVAGGAGPVRARLADELPAPAWDHVMDLNLKSAFLFSRAVLPAMRRGGFGRIVNFSSTISRGQAGSFTTVTGRLPYATSKSALIGFTSQLAKDEAEHGITVNAVLPGLILGAPGTRIRTRFEELPDEQRARMLNAMPMRRAGTPDEVAAVVAFLMSEAASYVSGVALPIDGAFL